MAEEEVGLYSRSAAYTWPGECAGVRAGVRGGEKVKGVAQNLPCGVMSIIIVAFITHHVKWEEVLNEVQNMLVNILFETDYFYASCISRLYFFFRM